jgi:very-short-patch-repair endonuclease
MFEHLGHPAAATGRARSLRRRMTRSEETLWAELRKLNVNFRRQAPIGRYFADFASHGGKLVVEVDGEVHERLPEVALRDIERQRWLEGEGYRVLRFTDRQVRADVHGCVEIVKKALLLDGGGLGGGVAAEVTGGRGMAPAPNGARGPDALLTPPSPALPPSRRKGEEIAAPSGETEERR